MRIDPVRRWVSHELPVSKIDPSAVGCSRVWGCTCHGAEVAPDCVFHAAAHHCDVVRAALGIIELDPLVNALLLFPDVSGNVVTKAACGLLRPSTSRRCLKNDFLIPLASEGSAKTTPQMTRFRDAKVCNNWLQIRIEDHRIQSLRRRWHGNP